MFRFQPKNIITEEAEAAMTMDGLKSRLDKLEDFIEKEEGEDLLRWLFSQQIEITSKTGGTLLKAYRNDTPYDKDHPEENWQFWVGKYEIDFHDIARGEQEVVHGSDSTPGFSHNDYFYAIKHIAKLHKEGQLEKIPERTLILLQTALNEQPSVRMHAANPQGRMIVVGLRYDTDPEWIEDTLRLEKSGGIINNALKHQRRWEPHTQMLHIADTLETDSLPVFFRGKLNTVPRTFLGIEKSAQDDDAFEKRLMKGLPEDLKAEDMRRMLSRSLRSMGDHEIRILDKDNKVQAVADVTKESMGGYISKLFRNYGDISDSLQDTIAQFGQNSEDHVADFEDLNYFPHWLRERAVEYLFGKDGSGALAQGISTLVDADEEPTQDKVMRWIERSLTEEGYRNQLYREHLRDPMVPRSRYMGKNQIWDQFMGEVNGFVSQKLPHILAELGHLK